MSGNPLSEAVMQFHVGDLRQRRAAEWAAQQSAEAALLAERRARLNALHPDKIRREQTAEERAEFTLLSDPLSRTLPAKHPLRERYAPLIELLRKQDLERQRRARQERRSVAAKKAAETRKAKRAVTPPVTRAKPKPAAPVTPPVTKHTCPTCGQPTRAPVTPPVTRRTCPGCGATFTPGRPEQVACSGRCRVRIHRAKATRPRR